MRQHVVLETMLCASCASVSTYQTPAIENGIWRAMFTVYQLMNCPRVSSNIIANLMFGKCTFMIYVFIIMGNKRLYKQLQKIKRSGAQLYSRKNKETIKIARTTLTPTFTPTPK